MPPSQPRVSRHSRVSACDPCGAPRAASTAFRPRRCIRKKDAPDDNAIGEHVVVIVVPLAGWAGSRSAFQEQVVFPIGDLGDVVLPRRQCLLTKAQSPPSGPLWLHEIKHDGFRVIARKDGAKVRLYSRPGNDLTSRFPLIVEALARLRSRSCIIDGEAVACDDNGMPNFDRIRYRRHDAAVFLYAFDLIELNGDDLRREPLDTRKASLASALRRAAPGIRLSDHIEADGPTVFAHACKMGLEGIVSKRKASAYRSGRSPAWLKMKNTACAALKREEEEDWGR